MKNCKLQSKHDSYWIIYMNKELETSSLIRTMNGWNG